MLLCPVGVGADVGGRRRAPEPRGRVGGVGRGDAGGAAGPRPLPPLLLPPLLLLLLAGSAAAAPVTKSRLEYVTDERFADFDAARAACHARGGTVARPRNEFELKAFRYTAGVHDGLWVGLLLGAGRWNEYHEDGSDTPLEWPLTFRDWLPDQPDGTPKNRERCVFAIPESAIPAKYQSIRLSELGRWVMGHCAGHYNQSPALGPFPTICRIPAPPCATPHCLSCGFCPDTSRTAVCRSFESCTNTNHCHGASSWDGPCCDRHSDCVCDWNGFEDMRFDERCRACEPGYFLDSVTGTCHALCPGHSTMDAASCADMGTVVSDLMDDTPEGADTVLSLSQSVAEMLNAVNTSNASAADVERMASVRERVLENMLRQTAGGSHRNNVSTTANESRSLRTLRVTAQLVAEPRQNTPNATLLASEFLDRELTHLAAASSDIGSSNNPQSSSVDGDSLDAVVGAVSNLLVSARRAHNGTIISAVAPRLHNSVQALSVLQLRGSAAGDAPIVRTSDQLTVVSQRHRGSALFGAAGDDATPLVDTAVSVFVPRLPASLLDGDSDNVAAVDSTLTTWTASPWSFEAGNVDTVVAGLTLNLPAHGHREVRVQTTADAPIRLVFRRRRPRRPNVRRTTEDDECVFLDMQQTPIRWSSRGCRRLEHGTNSSHVACACTHLTDFGARLVDSVASAGRVFGQLSDGQRESLLEKTSANVLTVSIVCSMLLVSVILCCTGELRARSKQRATRITVRQLKADMFTRRRFRQSIHMEIAQRFHRGSDSAGRSQKTAKQSLARVVEALRREFWTDEHLRVLKECRQLGTRPSAKKLHRPTLDVSIIGGTAGERALPPCGQRLCDRYRARLKLEHEWVAPFAVTVENRYFTSHFRVVLLTFVVLSQMAVEALLYDIRYPESGGTCAAVAEVWSHRVVNTTSNVSSSAGPGGHNASRVEDTTSATTSTATSETFPALDTALLERVQIGLISAVLTVPLALLCFSVLLKLAMSEKNRRLWEKFGTSDLGRNLLTIRKMAGSGGDDDDDDDDAKSTPCPQRVVGLTCCGSVAFVHVGSGGAGHLRSFTLTCRTVAHAAAAGSKQLEVHTRSRRRMTVGEAAHQHVREHKSSAHGILLQDPFQGRFWMPCDDANQVAQWVRSLRSIIVRLPDHATATLAAKAAAAGRYRHVQRCWQEFSLDDTPANPIRDNKADRQTLRKLVELCAGLHQHARRQRHLVERMLGGHRRRAPGLPSVALALTGAAAAGAAGASAASAHRVAAPTPRFVGKTWSGHDAKTPRRPQSIHAGVAEDAGSQHLFRLQGQHFTAALRQRLLPTAALSQEQAEDAAGAHLTGCLRWVYQCSVVSERHQIKERMQRRKKWCIQGLMSSYSVLCAVYVCLFGFCHGQDATLAWLESLLVQMALSAVVLRPLSILMLSGVLPTVSIEMGLAKGALKGRAEQQRRRGGSDGAGKEARGGVEEEEEEEEGAPPNDPTLWGGERSRANVFDFGSDGMTMAMTRGDDGIVVDDDGIQMVVL